MSMISNDLDQLAAEVRAARQRAVAGRGYDDSEIVALAAVLDLLAARARDLEGEVRRMGGSQVLAGGQLPPGIESLVARRAQGGRS